MANAGRSVALVSGCSTGIGRDVARLLAGRGFTVVAGARDPSAIEDLAARHRDAIHPIAWDVTDPGATRAAVEGTIDRFGGLHLLVNNAGYGQMGPLADLTREEWRRQLETNVIGLADAAALAARSPGGMIAARRGRIVNIGSIVGRMTVPFGGAYCASKYAVEAVSDALRMELAPFGIGVVLVEPGPILTAFSENAAGSLARLARRSDSPYEYLRPMIEERSRLSRRGGISAEACARVVVRVATMARPPARILVTPQARFYLWIKRLLPDRAYDALARRRFGLAPPAPRP
jgi:NAD(P)-dependent dehydrogenase (short-subunit alcohol dehydrogenase family)